jgi:beta-glucosidase
MSDVAVEQAKKQDVAVVCVGSHPEGNAGWAVVDSPSQGKEAVDRKALTLPAGQEEFVRRVYEANPKTVVVVISSFPVALPWAAANASTILHVTHNSQELGNALADVLLSATSAQPGRPTRADWPRALRLPPMMDYDIRHGRTYMYARAEPQYPFGYGLRIHHLLLCGPPAPARHLRPGVPISVSVDVTNKGARAGDGSCSCTCALSGVEGARPQKQLRGFQRNRLGCDAHRHLRSHRRGPRLLEREARLVVEAERGRLSAVVGDADLKQRATVAVAP